MQWSASPKGGKRVSSYTLASRLTGFVLLYFLGFQVQSAKAQKTDSVWIRNGDRITGEVKSMSQALLKYSTNDLGTVYIEWDKIDRISTTTVVEVRLASGQKYYGPLGLAPSRQVIVGSDTLPLGEIVKLTPIKSTFLSRLDGYLDIGLSYQKAHSAFQLSTGTRVQYRSPKAATSLDFTSYMEGRDDASQTSRLATAFTERLFVTQRWSAGVVVGLDKNDELDLSSRSRLVGFGTRTIVQSNRIEFLASGGLVVTRENYFSTGASNNGFEGLLWASFHAFRYDSPKLDASLVSQAYPSFSIPGRWRLQNDLRLSYELFSDFTLATTLFDTYDSKPQGLGTSKHDYGTTFSIGFTF